MCDKGEKIHEDDSQVADQATGQRMVPLVDIENHKRERAWSRKLGDMFQPH